jgi:hypothetical protein
MIYEETDPERKRLGGMGADGPVVAAAGNFGPRPRPPDVVPSLSFIGSPANFTKYSGLAEHI